MPKDIIFPPLSEVVTDVKNNSVSVLKFPKSFESVVYLDLPAVINSKLDIVLDGPKLDKKPYDDSNWREEYKSYTSNKRYIELLENGPKSLSQSWLLGALYNEWKQIKGYNKLDPKENEGQLQSSLKEFLNHQKDQGI